MAVGPIAPLDTTDPTSARSKWRIRVKVTRRQFNSEVGMAVRRELDAHSNAHVKKVASRLKSEFADLLKFGREMGIRGFDEVSENMNYMTRRHRIQALDDLVARDSSGNIHRLVAGSIQSANKKWMMPEWHPNRWQRSPNKVRFQIDSSERGRIRQAKWRWTSTKPTRRTSSGRME